MLTHCCYRSLYRSLVALVCTALLAACSASPSGQALPPAAQELPTDTAPAVESEATPMPDTDFRVIAYVTGGIVPEVIPYQRLTHINYAFLIPNPDGTFAPFANAWKLKKIAAEGQAAGVKVLISVGGWGWEKEFAAMAADPATRSAFVQNLVSFVAEHNLDGADIDWEYPQAGLEAEQFLQLIQELRLAMPDMLLTAAVVSHGSHAEGILDETFELFDFINVMTYDGPGHGSMEQFQTGLDYWQGRGLAPEKTVMGVPFYSRPGEVLYRKIVEADPQAAYQDELEVNGAVNHYNGIPTVQAKTRLAMQKASGIMFWTLDHDAQGDLSLLKAIDEVVNP